MMDGMAPCPRGPCRDCDYMGWVDPMTLPQQPNAMGVAAGPVLAVSLPFLVLYLLLAGMANGVGYLANQTLLAGLFPRPGDTLFRYVVSLITLVALLPGSLVVAAHLVRGGPLHVLRRWLLYPLAFLMVPVILFVTLHTTTADAVLLAQ